MPRFTEYWARIFIGCYTAVCLLGVTGCFKRDPIAAAIKRLGGSSSEQKQAVMELRLTSYDPVPQLEETAQNSKEKMRVRVAALEVLGDIARRQKKDDALVALHRMLSSEEPQLRKAAVKGFTDSEYTEAVPDLIKLKNGASEELLAEIENALETTSRKIVKDIENQWNSPETAMKAYTDAEVIGLDRGMVGYSKGKFLEMRGHKDAADAKYAELGIIRSYWMIGPFPNRQGMGFRTVYPPEKGIDLTAEYPSYHGPITWYRLDRELSRGILNFESYFVETDNVVGYALVYLIAKEDVPIEARIGSDDTLQLYLNNEVIYENEQYRALSFDDDIIPLVVPRGTNTLLIKVTEDWGAWDMIARLTGAGDTPLKGVEISLDAVNPD